MALPLGLIWSWLTFFSSGDWLLNKFNTRVDDQTFKGLASSVWTIWIARCELVFKKIKPDFRKIFHRGIQYIFHFFKNLRITSKEFNSYIIHPQFVTLFWDASWVVETSPCSIVFVMVLNYSDVVCTYCGGIV